MKVWLLFAAALLPSPAIARPDERAEVKAAVDTWLSAINANDADKLAANQLPQGMTFRQKHEADGSTSLSSRSNADWVERARAEKARLRERYWNPTILVHGGIATFWAPYSFDIEGKRSHCGVDVFDLIKVGGEWKVANAMWTVEPQGCPKGH